MAKDITLKSPNGEEIYYPKTVSDLVYDNESGKTLKQQIKEKTWLVKKGLFYVPNGSTKPYSLSNTVFVKIPTKDCIIKNYWSTPYANGLTWFDSSFKFISQVKEAAVTTEFANNCVFNYVVDSVEVPANAAYLAIHFQVDSFTIESDEDLFVVGSDIIFDAVNRIDGAIDRIDGVDTVISGKNLYNVNNPQNFIKGYLHTVNGNLFSSGEENGSSYVSYPIAVKSNTAYCLRREHNIGTSCIRLLDKDGNISKPIKPSTNEEYSDYDCDYLTIVPFKTKEDTTHIQFTIQFNFKDSGNVQLEEGLEFTEYEEFGKVNLNRLGKDVKKLIENTTSANSTTITIANSDKIGFFSNSFLNGYAMKNKHTLNNLSMFTDYILYNYGHSGDDILELLARVQKNEIFLGYVPVNDWGIKYGVIAMQDNDGALFNYSSDTYYENAKKLANMIKTMGAEPILSTEHDDSWYYYNFSRLANEEQYMFMNWGVESTKYFNGIYKPMWYNSHPATRTGWLWTNGMKPYIDSLPKPKQSIKLFRSRNENALLDSLLYEDMLGRSKNFVELSCGVLCLSDPTKFDRLDSLPEHVTIYDEYQTIQTNRSVTFGNYALAEVITPYSRLNNFKLKLSATGITSAYVKIHNRISNPLSEKRFIAFGLESGSLNKGDTFTITGGVFSDTLKLTYTVEDVVNGIVVTTTNSSGKTTSGTDNPTCNVAGVTFKGSYDFPSADYMNRYKKPYAEWKEVTLTDGVIDLTDVKDYLLFDKVAILLKGSNITISDISAICSGTEKQIIKKDRIIEKVGNSLIQDTLFDDGSSWGADGLSKYVPVTNGTETEKLPKGITTVRIIKNGEEVKQNISTVTNSALSNKQVQIKVMVRMFPTYVDSDSKYGAITPTSFDMGELDVYVGTSKDDSNPVKVGSIKVGLWWNTYLIDTPYFSGFNTIFLKSNNDFMQIAKCEVIEV